jgi:phosphotransferase family enzyme
VAAGLRERAVSAAVAVARGYGVEVREPRVLSDRSNVIVELAPAPVVARVAGSTADVRPGGAADWLARDVDLGTYLAADEAEVVPPAAEPPPGPHAKDGLAVAFWRFVDHDRSRPPTAREAGQALRRLHDALAGFPGELPSFAALLDECEALIARLGLPGAQGLRAAFRRIRSEIASARLPSRPLHGDATPSNLLRTPAGLLWTDFEDSCAGPVEWDLACLAISAGPGAAETLAAYGREHEEALEPFLEARRLQLAVWTALLAERHPELRARADERLRDWLR